MQEYTGEYIKVISNNTLETCELCNTEKSATYTSFGVGVLGAALCPDCRKIARKDAFKKELAHMLATGDGDLEKFIRIAKSTPKCRVCGCELKTSNWSESRQKNRQKICRDCNNSKIKVGYGNKGILPIANTINGSAPFDMIALDSALHHEEKGVCLEVPLEER